ncbi:hypothetical protein [Desulfuromonas acetoxidans]|uniref:DAHP synthase ferredoxin-like domain-containing protein n=1 Tax=Desulfuromonas acetoxidans (strain DSM 684 / 11070) TaxID=281689 RepID=Q1K2H5_DESA6|nr:hypothetical protein [Desulfuromonas acetoxidans]EAT16906.1 conserved hypothetical protein [Desulfuromonas acetoxidans DSM 684]MBF0645537.1 hypothetical protein [Desulfuromonas acetoxidans]NVD23853.1 hypothetical protein [Desulfuromonas acetoxidans]NVE15750.1 hypothetical protein [Desulfuromonas acetoxidans]
MLVVMKKDVSEENLQQVKQYLIDEDFDFHQSTGANRTILGVIGDTREFSTTTLETLPGVHVVFKIPPES